MLAYGPPATTGALADELVDFGELPEAVNALLQAGVLAHRRSKQNAEARFREALAVAPDALPVYFCLYKIHTYEGELEAALHAAQAGLVEATRQAGWPSSFEEWPETTLTVAAERFALYTLKAVAFIRLKRGETDAANAILKRLRILDPAGQVGWRVIQDLFEGVR